MNNWIQTAKDLGFDEAVALKVATLQPRADVRAMCQADKCGAYGKNWTCPPHCGTLEECGEKLQSYRQGILLQTVGKLEKTIDSKGYLLAEQRHLAQFHAFTDILRKSHPDALCLGAGGCRICQSCAYPEACRFPEKARQSMEACGIDVVTLSRQCGIKYINGADTVTYFSMLLF